MDSVAPETHPPGSKRLPAWSKWAAAACILLLLSLVAWRGLFVSYPIKLSASAAPAEKGWQIEADPFWVRAEAVAPLPEAAQWNGQYVIMVFKDGEPYYQRMIDAQQIEVGKPFDLALEKQGVEYSAAFVEVEAGRPGGRISNTLTFRH